jgi:post-segregation antitoxin (ccd killing protein)
MSRAASPALSATDVTLPDGLLREAKEMRIYLLQACERGLATEAANVHRQC